MGEALERVWYFLSVGSPATIVARKFETERISIYCNNGSIISERLCKRLRRPVPAVHMLNSTDLQHSGDIPFSKRCEALMAKRFGVNNVQLTTSGTSALEVAALLCDLTPGDEVIMPSYTFASTANAFCLRGARIKFVDIHADTLNIDEAKIESAVSPRTRVIIPVHYAGVGADAIMDLARKHGLIVVEDAAQAVNARYRGLPLGTTAHMGCYSFHQCAKPT